MKLLDIIRDFPCEYDGDRGMEIADVSRDSRKVTLNSMFFCITGFTSDGHDYAKTAAAKGAAVLVVTRKLELDIPQILVKDDRLAMAVFCANFFGNPSEKLKMVGITGTNGKTSVTYLCGGIAEKLGKKVGIIGTIRNKILDKEYNTTNTTPESLELQKLLAKMVEAGVEVVFMEVSSHSLALNRVGGITFDVGAFTNLSQDHLDFHGNMENYLEAKSGLFAQSRVAVINKDDNVSDRLIGAAGNKAVTYAAFTDADYKAEEIKKFSWGNTFEVGNQEYTLHIPGMFSVYNSLCAISICKELGYGDSEIAGGLAQVSGVDGRAEVLNQEPTIILDYAHTPDGLENILKTFVGMGKLVCIFGAGGDRDVTKRPKMGKIAGQYCDFVIITSDNPRSEEPRKIMQDIEAGIQETDCAYIMIENRKEAIAYAIEKAKPKDILVLAGKGHETYQEIAGVRHEFDEKKIVKEILK